METEFSLCNTAFLNKKNDGVLDKNRMIDHAQKQNICIMKLHD
jgi:DUF1009 family protein